jgi:DNA-binding LacI/PurR family transcriptional regulator
MARIKDVARAAGVSSATVSRVLAHKDYVRESTRRKVMDAVEMLNYQPSRVARSLRVKSSQIIGLIISDIQNPFFTSLVRAVEDVAYESKYAVFLCNSDEDVEKESLYIDLMISEHVAGVIITTTQETNSPCKKLLEANIPMVSVDRRVNDCDVDMVVLDNFKGAENLVDYLIEKGHTRIGAILGICRITTGRERFEGYLSALARHHIPYDAELVRFGLPKEETGYRSAIELLSSQNPPTALFTGNNQLAIGAFRAIKSQRLDVPYDIALVSFDDPEWATMIQPQLTVAAQPTYELGHKAAELVMRRIANPSSPSEVVVFPPKIKIRGSVNIQPR